MIGRKQLPGHLGEPYRSFLAVLDEVEPAKAGLTDVVPGTRLPGRPLHDAVAEYRARLGRVVALMPAWRCLELETEWQACDAGIHEALDRADRLLGATEDPAGFEGLLWTVERLLDPLEPFGAAAERFQALHRRVPRKN